MLRGLFGQDGAHREDPLDRLVPLVEGSALGLRPAASQLQATVIRSSSHGYHEVLFIDQDASSPLGTLQSHFAQLFTGRTHDNVVIL